jgi:hypothetical protein
MRPSSTDTPRVPAQRGDALTALAGALRGQLALPGSEAYDRLRTPFNLAVRVEPLAVVRAVDAYDVATAVRIAREHGLRVGVQSTGHGTHASMDGALLVHTGLLAESVVHPGGWARVGAGVTWRTVLDAAAEHGLTGLAGSSSGVGVVGYTTGGGVGPMARTYGVASDRVRAFDVVTGQGRLVRATPDEHGDLYWGLRGGRGSLGIVTAVEMDLVPQRTVHGGCTWFSGADIPVVLRAWASWVRTLPEVATSSVALLQLPPLPHVPPPLAGRATLAVRYVHTGDAREAEALLAPLRALATPVLESMGELASTDLDAVHRDPVDPMPAVKVGRLLRELPPGAVDSLLDLAGPGTGSPLTVLELRHLGGAVARPGPHPSAVCHRDAAFALTCIGAGVPPVADAVATRARTLLSALSPWSTGFTLPNFGGGPLGYDAPTLERLRSLVSTHDPAGVLLAADDLS